MHRILALVLIAVVAVGAGRAVLADAAGLVVKERSADFATTVERLRSEIEARGAAIVATVDHAAAAEAHGLKLRPTTVIVFGNPRLGTPLMQGRQTAGLDLPLRVLVWKDEAGKVHVGFRPPAQIGEEHCIDGLGAVTDKMAGTLDAITAAATGM